MAKYRKCVRYKTTAGGKRCAKYSGTKRKRGGSKGGTKGKHCVRFKRTAGGKRCAKFS